MIRWKKCKRIQAKIKMKGKFIQKASMLIASLRKRKKLTMLQMEVRCSVLNYDHIALKFYMALNSFCVVYSEL